MNICCCIMVGAATSTSFGAPPLPVLSWGASQDANVNGYYVYDGTNTGVYTEKWDAGNVTNYVLGTALAVPLYIVVAAYNSNIAEVQPPPWNYPTRPTVMSYQESAFSCETVWVPRFIVDTNIYTVDCAEMLDSSVDMIEWWPEVTNSICQTNPLGNEFFRSASGSNSVTLTQIPIGHWTNDP